MIIEPPAFTPFFTQKGGLISPSQNVGLTIVHEIGHFIFDLMMDNSLNPNTSKDFHESSLAIIEWLGVGAGDVTEIARRRGDVFLSTKNYERYVQYHETFAEAFQSYFIEGKPPANGPIKAFKYFSKIMLEVYDCLLYTSPSPRD